MLFLIIKGFIIGFFMLFPGLSGGSIAIMLGEYSNIINKSATLFSNFKKSFSYLFFMGLGGLCGLYFSSQIIKYFITNFSNEMIYFFLGIMSLFIINFIKENINNKLKLKQVIFISIGILISVFFNFIPSGFISLDSLFSLFILGIVLAIALILPGISFSYVLLIFSAYDDIVSAIINFDINYLFKIGIFLLIGINLTIKFLQKYLNKYPINSNLLISGFMIGSFVTFIPIPTSISTTNIAFIFFMLGILIFLIFGKIVKK